LAKFDHHNEWAAKVQGMLAERRYENAIDVIERELLDNPDNSHALVLSGRCFLALNQPDRARTAYETILSNAEEPSIQAKAEAELILGKNRTALKHFETALEEDTTDREARFLASTAAYKEGFIHYARELLKQAILLGFEWEDEDPVDFVIKFLLTTPEFSDFELIYLDVDEEVEQGKATVRNRWFSLSLPIYDLFTTSDPKLQAKRAVELAEMLLPEFDESFFEEGAQKLEKILRDFSYSQSDARFGLEALKQLQEKKWDQLSGLILGLELEHLKEFAGFFGLDAQWIKNSQLQGLIPLLPQRIAIGFMFLYAASDPKDQLQKMSTHRIDDKLLTSLLAASFINFYREIDRYRQSSKSPP
jgi:tetratricopeptide (TPR) repeat protein